MATYTGTSGNDNLAGTSAADLILGDMGDDNLVGNGGLDSIYGGMGNDNITFGPSQGFGAANNDTSSDIIYGGYGSDTITSRGVGATGDFGFNTVYGGTGNATNDATDTANLINLTNEVNGGDIVFAGGGGDSIFTGGTFGSSVTGGAGNDLINETAAGSRAVINANAGNDSVFGSAGGGDSIHGGQGNDAISVTGTLGNLVSADLGNDSIVSASSGNESLYGGKGNDVIQLTGSSGNDLVFGGLDSDSIAVANTVTFNAAGTAITGAAADSIYGGTDTTGTAADSSNFISASNTTLAANAGYTPVAPVGAAAVPGVAVAGNGVGTADGRDLLVGGGGNDVIVASDATTTFTATTAGAVAQPTAVDTLTGGGGNDLFVFGAATGSEGYSNVNARASTVDSVTDFVSGTDQFKFGGGNATSLAVDNTGNAQTSVNNSGATTLAQAATAVISGAGPGAPIAANSAAIFSYGGTNYLLANTGGTLATDYLINVGSLTNVTTKDING